MPIVTRAFKYSGRVAEGDLLHRAWPAEVVEDAHKSFRAAPATAPTDFIIAPHYVDVPGGIRVPQWAPTVVGTAPAYDPAGDCDGCFMSSKFQPNNNCYNYACDIATNSFAQPGRLHGTDLGRYTEAEVVAGATRDGLVRVGGPEVAARDLGRHLPAGTPGHPVALLISPPDDPHGWHGDYHWVRCDDLSAFSRWSQKDGTDQVTDFDFAGRPIVDPSTANWVVNQGPRNNVDVYDVVIHYALVAWMFVPRGGVAII